MTDIQTEDKSTVLNQAAKDELRSYVERIERLEEEKAALTQDIKDIFANAKQRGYDVSALKVVIKLRKKDADERRDEEMILATYMLALGMDTA